MVLNKQGEIAWDYIGKIVLVLIVVVVILFGIIALTGKSSELFLNIKSIFRMGR